MNALSFQIAHSLAETALEPTAINDRACYWTWSRDQVVHAISLQFPVIDLILLSTPLTTERQQYDDNDPMGERDDSPAACHDDVDEVSAGVVVVVSFCSFADSSFFSASISSAVRNRPPFPRGREHA